ncbi:MAG: iron-containing alcohol dehydrogenase, partial [Nitratireductor sp.]|nr:iron-containing alcohol dehydrogenase [Nitratireductor sp.]
MNPFTFNTSKSIRFGEGAVNKLGEIIKDGIGDRVMLVTDPGMISTGLVERALSALSQADVAVELFSEVEADPPEHVILAAAAKAREAAVDGVVGFGGGSSLDVAKLVALLAPGKEALAEVYGVGNAKGPRLPLILVP